MDERFQVFVSSTYEDLIEARQEVIWTLLKLDCIPAGMELFPASNEEKWTLIRKTIDGCDYYLVVIGGQCGSCGPDGVSYTQLEYQYAIQQGKPVIAFLHKDPDSLPVEKRETDPQAIARLNKFRSICEEKPCNYWSTPSDLGAAVSQSLIKLIKTNPATGWVKADQVIPSDGDDSIVRFPPHLRNTDIAGLWLSRFEYKSYRGGRLVLGCQYDVELIQASGRRSIQGRNVLCCAANDDVYWHDLRAQILGSYIMGNWFNRNSVNLGLFQLYIHTHRRLMTGSHIGNANDNSVQCGAWIWLRINLAEGSGTDIAKSISRREMRSPSEIDDKFKSCYESATSISLDQVLREV